jgi:hypothetical protein
VGGAAVSARVDSVGGEGFVCGKAEDQLVAMRGRDGEGWGDGSWVIGEGRGMGAGAGVAASRAGRR